MLLHGPVAKVKASASYEAQIEQLERQMSGK